MPKEEAQLYAANELYAFLILQQLTFCFLVKVDLVYIRYNSISMREREQFTNFFGAYNQIWLKGLKVIDAGPYFVHL